MFIEVEMLAFGKPNQIRLVHVPDLGGLDLEKALDVVYLNGQNDVQPQRCPSVSVGDVIRFQNQRFVVASCGFEKICVEE